MFCCPCPTRLIEGAPASSALSTACNPFGSIHNFAQFRRCTRSRRSEATHRRYFRITRYFVGPGVSPPAFSVVRNWVVAAPYSLQIALLGIKPVRYDSRNGSSRNPELADYVGRRTELRR